MLGSITIRASTLFLSLLTTVFMSGPVAAADLVIGSVMSQKGPAAGSGAEFLKGTKAYFDYINSSGGINGNKLILVTGDDGGEKGSDPNLTVSEFNRLANDAKPIAFVNASGTPNMEALLKDGNITKAGIPVVGPFSLSNKLRVMATPNMFFVRTGAQEEAGRMVRQATSMTVSKIAIIYFDSGFGKELHTLATEQLKLLPQMTVNSIVVDPQNSDLDAAAKAAVSGGAQMIFLFTPGRLASGIVKAYRDKGGAAFIVASSATSADQVVREIGADKAKGLGVIQVVPLAYRKDVPLVKEYQAAMSAVNPSWEPTAYSLEGYVNAKILVEGIRRTRLLTPAGVNASLRRIKDYDLGGLIVDLTDPAKSGLKFSGIGIIRPDGKLKM